MNWQIETLGDVRRFVALICLTVLAGGALLRGLVLPPDLAARTLMPGALMALMLAAPLAYAIGQRLQAAHHRATQLEHALHHDPLTGVRSRSSLFATVPACPDRPCAVILADIDHFKGFNDRHGHAAGDLALRQFAAILTGNCRAIDLVARLGGEEFVIVMQNTSLADGHAAARRLAHRTRQSPVFLGARSLTLTASFGVALLPPGGPLDTALQQADRTLYRAKHEGRNRAYAYDPTLDSLPAGLSIAPAKPIKKRHE
ncbi:MAG: diguanylate cyclase [Roseovarius sp. BRH_c41]|uniref:GGDEF domain-containing protein n=1 Tax=Roseovarius sp. BRH_c41 TaxID=1629709 RepID=UPI0005F18379|nr:GGDEF domain-containing protein [Roseovarius sp. BRH_c41]KJS45018.1 MAG: diguanylate cyclase [Roseovarius sp. BRH_c41]